MGKGSIIGLTVGVVVILIAGILFMNIYGIKKQEIALRNQYHAIEKSNKELKGTVFKIIKQSAGVAEKWASHFDKQYEALIGGREGGSLMKWVQEANPNFPPDLYQSLMDKIEGLNMKFVHNQKKLHDIKLQHDNLLDDPIAGMFLAGKERLPDITIVTARAEQEFSTGIDSDTGSVF